MATVHVVFSFLSFFFMKQEGERSTGYKYIKKERKFDS